MSQKIYTLLKRWLLKWKFLRLLSARFKTCQIPDVNFETTSQFPSKYFIPLQFHERQFLCTFFSSNNIYFGQKEIIKVKILETFKWSDQNLSNSLCQFLNDKSILLQILYPYSISWTITPLYWFCKQYIISSKGAH